MKYCYNNCFTIKFELCTRQEKPSVWSGRKRSRFLVWLLTLRLRFSAFIIGHKRLKRKEYVDIAQLKQTRIDNEAVYEQTSRRATQRKA